MSRQMKYKKSAKERQRNSPWVLSLLAAGGLLLVLAAVFAFDQSVKPKAEIEVTGAPSLKVDQEKIDLGDVKLGVPVKVSFQLSNVGDKALRFTQEPYVEILEGC
ncbi:MAG: hypothetical protein ACOYYS_16015 [Chloroflexota bacterium]